MEVAAREHLPAVVRMSKDVRAAAEQLSEAEARFLVDSYYSMQENRIREAARIRSMQGRAAEAAEVEEDAEADLGEPHSVIAWLFDQNTVLESQIKGALGRYAGGHPVGQWALSQHGIGPVIAAGLLAHLDPTYPTVGHIFSFCGLDPTKTWSKGEKRPWSHAAKQLAFKIGDSMVRQSKNPKCLYGALYRARKDVETRKNEAGQFAVTAAETLKIRTIKDSETRKLYEQGKLPKGRIDLRARRYAVKMFLSHWHTVAFFHATGKMPPAPYAIAQAGHAHYIAPPEFDASRFPVADPVREPRSTLLSDAVAAHQRAGVKVISSFEEAAELIRNG